MKIVTHPKKIQRNYKIGMYTSLASLVLLIGAVGFTLTSLNNPETANYSFFAMLGGLILSQVGVYYANRWGKSPRIDERITAGLKGLDDRYTLYNYTTPVPHLLAGPSGFFVIAPQYQAGTITYEKNRYRQKGVGFLSRVIGQEGLGRPDLEALSFVEDLKKYIQKNLPEAEIPMIEPLVVFTSPKASVQTQDAPVTTLHVEKLKDVVRRKTKEQPANITAVRKIQEILPDEDIS